MQGVAALLEMVTNLQLGVRLGLLSPDKQQVLLLHVDMPAAPPSTCDEDGEPTCETIISSSYVTSTAGATGRLLAECKDTDGTLLAEAVAAGEPRCIQDTTAAYLEVSAGHCRTLAVGNSWERAMWCLHPAAHVKLCQAQLCMILVLV